MIYRWFVHWKHPSVYRWNITMVYPLTSFDIWWFYPLTSAEASMVYRWHPADIWWFIDVAGFIRWTSAKRWLTSVVSAGLSLVVVFYPWLIDDIGPSVNYRRHRWLSWWPIGKASDDISASRSETLITFGHLFGVTNSASGLLHSSIIGIISGIQYSDSSTVRASLVSFVLSGLC